ncbi:MAG: hypothetical protein IT558_05935 [Alphaproteobacteria bacterium]|nr:hypothetical protein [Alphaproteobacteria bacterium]
MNIQRLIAILPILVFLVAAPVQAAPKPTYWDWWPGHWDKDMARPHLEDGKMPHNSQWENDKWTPQDWTASRGSEMDVLQGLYDADILRDQYRNGDNIPVLQVGPNFLRLSGQEKRRVAAYIDQVFGITSSSPDGMFYIYLSRGWFADPIGTYTRRGLQLQ